MELSVARVNNMKLQSTKWTNQLHELVFYNDNKVYYKLLVYDYAVSKVSIVRYDKTLNKYETLYENKLNDKSYKFCKKLYKAIIKQEMLDRQLDREKELLKEIV